MLQNQETVPSRNPKGTVASRTDRPRWTFYRRIKWAVRIAFLVALAIMLVMGCDGCFYFPSREIVYTPETFRLDYEEVRFKTSDGVELWGWFLKADGPPKGTVLHFHGNAQNISTHIVESYWLPRYGYNVLLFDYRGYGKSQGRVTRAGTVLDGHAAVDYLLSRDDVDPKRLVMFGQSLGGAVGLAVAAERPEIAAMVVDAAFGDYRRVATRHVRKALLFEPLAALLVKMLISEGHDPIDLLDRLAPRPLFVIASGKDRICYPDLSRELFDAAHEPKQFCLVEDAAHLGMIQTAGLEAERRITDFYEQALSPAPSPTAESPGP